MSLLNGKNRKNDVFWVKLTFLTNSSRSLRNPFNSSFSMVPLLSFSIEDISQEKGDEKKGKEKLVYANKMM